MFFPHVMESVCFMNEFLSTFVTFCNLMLVLMTSMIYQFLMSFEPVFALITVKFFVKQIHAQLKENESVNKRVEHIALIFMHFSYHTETCHTNGSFCNDRSQHSVK